jgi:hypothetical protein
VQVVLNRAFLVDEDELDPHKSVMERGEVDARVHDAVQKIVEKYVNLIQRHLPCSLAEHLILQESRNMGEGDCPWPDLSTRPERGNNNGFMLRPKLLTVSGRSSQVRAQAAWQDGNNYLQSWKLSKAGFEAAVDAYWDPLLAKNDVIRYSAGSSPLQAKACDNPLLCRHTIQDFFQTEKELARAMLLEDEEAMLKWLAHQVRMRILLHCGSVSLQPDLLQLGCAYAV